MIRWGILSTARISQAVLFDTGAQVVAVASRDRERGTAFATKQGVKRALESYQALIEDPGIDAVYNPLPNGLHVEWSIRALEAGKHVLCEKPLGRRVADVESAFDAADRAGRVLVEALFWRHHPQVDRAIELLEAGTIGRPQLVRSSCCFPLRDESDIRMNPDLDGGALMDVGCYCVHGVRAVLGSEPTRVYAEQTLTGTGRVDIATAATLRFADDVTGIVDCSFVTQDRAELEVVGEDGSLVFSNPFPEPGSQREYALELRRPGDSESIAVPQVDAYAAQLANVEAMFSGEAPRLPDQRDSVGQARVIEALFDSAHRGASVTL